MRLTVWGSFCNRVEQTGFINPAVLLEALPVVGANSLHYKCQSALAALA